jgi:TolB-like protein/Tfp pilus assembly protein PilF
MSPKKFFSELKRRNVYRVAVAYAFVGWLLIQIATSTFPVLEIPNWAIKLVIVLVVIGFPIAVVIAWAFEMTSEGMKPTEAIPPNERPLPGKRRKFAALIITVAIAAIGLLLFQLWGGAEKSIAVLPFDGDAGIPGFSLGLLEDVLNNLAKIKNLKVISRTSALSYPNKASRNRAKIGEELGVSHILEGSVQPAGDRILAAVELFDTSRDEPIWKNKYTPTKVESIALSNDLALEIASVLRISLTPREKKRLASKLTENSDAWTAYHKGREIQLQRELSERDYLSATDFYQEAVNHDPGFALAQARLSFMQVILYQIVDRGNARFLADARANADQAFDHDPDSAEAHLALARCAFLEGKRDRISPELSNAVRLLPNDASLRLSVALTQQQLGWQKEAASNYKRAAELGPRQARIFFHEGFLLYEMGRQGEACDALEHALALEPKTVQFRITLAVAEISRSGDIGRAWEILSGLPVGDSDGRVASARCTLAILQRDFSGALKILEEYPGTALPTIDSGGLAGPDSRLEAEGTIRLLLGNRERESARVNECFASVRSQYEEAAKTKPQSAVDGVALALLYAWLGLKKEAIAEAERVSTLETPAGPVQRGVILGLAKTYVWAGEPDRAWRQIEQFLNLPPSGYSLNNFRLDPVWDPIRNDPRFQKRIQKKR